MSINIRPLDLDLIEPSRRTFRDPDQGGSKIVVIGKPGCFGVGTMVLRSDGKAVPIESIRQGDVLVGDEGGRRVVLDLCRGVGLFYSIHAVRDGRLIARVNDMHILTLRNVRNKTVVDIPIGDFLSMCVVEDDGSFRSPTRFRWMIYRSRFVAREIRFMIRPTGLLEQYYGVVVDGNHRFLLADGSVVHNTGKTTLIASLLYEKSSIFPVGLVMSGTEDSNGFYKKIFPSTFVYNKLEEKKIEDFVVRQKIAKRHVDNPWAILLLDDCTDEPKTLSKPIFQGLYKNGRHWKMLFILSLQYCMDIRPVIRTNIDGTFILRETNLRNRKTLWENYAGVIPDFNLFCRIMDSITDNYTALYIHNAIQSNKIEDCVFWYKAKKIPSEFKFGAPDFWRFHKQRYDPRYQETFQF